jgi:hypothetical protein
MNGPIALIHQVSKLPATSQLIAILQRLGVKTVSIEVLRGTYKINTAGNNDKDLMQLCADLRAAGFQVEGWGYTYFEQSGAQGDAIMERVEKLDFTQFMINPEKEWVNVVGGPKAAKLLMDKLKVKGLEVGFCSYRYPSLHPMPYLAFLSHEAIDFIAPQVYWIDSHNPAYQLERSVVEYRELSDLPVVPIAPTFPQGSWAPTPADFKEFIAKVKTMKLPTWGFFDEALFARKDWMDAIAGGVSVPPPPPPIAAPYLKFRVTSIKGLTKRKGPGQSYAALGAWPYGAVLNVVNVGGEIGCWGLTDEATWGCIQLGATRYMEPGS